MNTLFRKGFTLIELLVVVLIIGILAAVALPQYQKAVLKSRYSSLMPIGKAIANGNEVYYMEHGTYASAPTQLDITGQSAKYPDGTQVSMSPTTDTRLSYVLVTNDNVNNARYLVYQKHSPNFADTTMCEAGDNRAKELCQALGGVAVTGGGNSQQDDWTAYLLTGTYGNKDSFTIPVFKGEPTCTPSGSGTICTYTKAAGGTVVDIVQTKGETKVNCPTPTTCTATDYANNANGYHKLSITRADWGHDLVIYDADGKLQTIEIVPIINGRYAGDFFYDANGNLMGTSSGFTMPSEDQLAAIAESVQNYIGKTKCELYPELQSCAD